MLTFVGQEPSGQKRHISLENIKTDPELSNYRQRHILKSKFCLVFL